MAFKEGNPYRFKDGNKGRPKGSKEDFKKQIQSLLDSGFDKFKTELDGLSGRTYAEMYIKLMEFVVPKMKAVEMQLETDEKQTKVVNYIRAN